MSPRLSIRFYRDREVRAAWDDRTSRWLYSVLDVIAALNGEADYTRTRNYWKYLKGKLRREGSELVSGTNQLKLLAPDGKHRLTDVLDLDSVIKLAQQFPNQRAAAFLAWFTRSDDTLDGRSRQKAYELYESGLIRNIEVGTVRGLQQIHAYLFGGLYDFAGQIRQVNIAKGGFQFAMAQYLPETLATIERMKEESVEDVVDKYVEMNVAHPFREGNGRATRIWLDRMLARAAHVCVDWSRVDKRAYLDAMTHSVASSAPLLRLLQQALTPRIDDRETYMKGIDYSYYYEQEE